MSLEQVQQTGRAFKENTSRFSETSKRLGLDRNRGIASIIEGTDTVSNMIKVNFEDPREVAYYSERELSMVGSMVSSWGPRMNDAMEDLDYEQRDEVRNAWDPIESSFMMHQRACMDAVRGQQDQRRERDNKRNKAMYEVAEVNARLAKHAEKIDSLVRMLLDHRVILMGHAAIKDIADTAFEISKNSVLSSVQQLPKERKELEKVDEEFEALRAPLQEEMKWLSDSYKETLNNLHGSLVEAARKHKPIQLEVWEEWNERARMEHAKAAQNPDAGRGWRRSDD